MATHEAIYVFCKKKKKTLISLLMLYVSVCVFALGEECSVISRILKKIVNTFLAWNTENRINVKNNADPLYCMQKTAQTKKKPSR